MADYFIIYSIVCYKKKRKKLLIAVYLLYALYTFRNLNMTTHEFFFFFLNFAHSVQFSWREYILLVVLHTRHTLEYSNKTYYNYYYTFRSRKLNTCLSSIKYKIRVTRTRISHEISKIITVKYIIIITFCKVNACTLYTYM